MDVCRHVWSALTERRGELRRANRMCADIFPPLSFPLLPSLSPVHQSLSCLWLLSVSPPPYSCFCSLADAPPFPLPPFASLSLSVNSTLAIPRSPSQRFSLGRAVGTASSMKRMRSARSQGVDDSFHVRILMRPHDRPSVHPS